MKNRAFTLVLASFILVGTLSGCAGTANTEQSANVANSPTTDISSDENTSNTSEVSYTAISVVTDKLKDEDTDSTWNGESATHITLNGDTAAVTGNRESVTGGTVTITKAGTYVISGTLSKGQIYINACSGDMVRLVLNGVDITAAQNAAIYSAQADKLIIVLADGTANKVADAGTAFTYTDTTAEEPDAAVFSKCDLSITGEGSLTVESGFNNGIGTKDDIVITGGQFVINAANHGIRGRDSVTITGGSFDIAAGNDGVQSNNDEDASKGWVDLTGGVFKITAGHDGVQAESDLLIAGGEYTIITGGSVAQTVSADSSGSYKGIKAGGNISVSGGTITIDSVDDSIHANGNVSLTGGNYTLTSGDDGVHSDVELTIDGGNIKIIKSYEGIEGANVNISNGKISISASDDGVNAAGGNDGGMGGGFGKDNFRQSGNYAINISGGELVLVSGGDGIDSNGSITVTGGTVIAIIQSSRDNGAIDCDGTFTVTGGNLVYGGTGIGQIPGGDSTQSYAYVSCNITAGFEVTLQQEGDTIISFTSPISCQYLAFSSPDVVSGQNYTVNSGSDSSVSVTAGTGGGQGGMVGKQGGGMGGKQRPGG